MKRLQPTGDSFETPERYFEIRNVKSKALAKLWNAHLITVLNIRVLY